MLDEISGLGAGWLDRLLRSSKAKAGRTEKGESADLAEDDKAELAISPDLSALLDRIKGAETMRKGLVHAVIKKLNRGALVTSETVRDAAEKILREGP